MYKRKDGLYVDTVPIKGQKRPKYFYGKTKAEVKKKIAAWSEQHAEADSFSAVSDRWDSYHASLVTVNANKVYAAPLRRANEYFSGMLISEISAAEVQAFVRFISGQGFSRRSVQLHRDMLNMIFDYYISQPESSLKFNPVSAVRLPSNLPKTRRLPPSDEQLKLISPDTESSMGLFAFFLLYTGLRRGELLGLRWEDIDREEKLIHVQREVIYESNQPKVVPRTKSEAGIRSVDLLDILAAVLPNKHCGYVFGGTAPLSKTQFRKQWIAFCREIGEVDVVEKTTLGKNGREYISKDYKPRLTPHQFRHAYASMLDDAGIDETVAMALLGHSSIAVTKDIYTHLRQPKKARSAAALNDYIARAK